MLRIGIDKSALDEKFKSHAQRGAGRYVRELVRYFESVRDPIIETGTFDYHDVQRDGVLDAVVDHMPAGRQTIKQQVIYPFRLKTGATTRFDYLHFPAHIDAPSWCQKPYVVTVLDLIPVVLQDLYSASRSGWRFRLARWLELKAIRNASLVLAISENTARDVNRVLNVPYDRIVVTPLGVDDRFFSVPQEDVRRETLRRFGLTKGQAIVLYVGGIDQRKNMKGLLNSFARLRAQPELEGYDPVLVMVGEIESDAEYPLLVRVVKELQLEPHIKMLGYVPDEDLLGLYRECSVFFFPSLYEGFGLTPLEAMAAGAPVVSSGESSLSEVLGDAALVVDPQDTASCAEALGRVLMDNELAARLRSEGPQQARKFPWSRTGDLTLAAYRQLEHESAKDLVGSAHVL